MADITGQIVSTPRGMMSSAAAAQAGYSASQISSFAPVSNTAAPVASSYSAPSSGGGYTNPSYSTSVSRIGGGTTAGVNAGVGQYVTGQTSGVTSGSGTIGTRDTALEQSNLQKMIASGQLPAGSTLSNQLTQEKVNLFTYGVGAPVWGSNFQPVQQQPGATVSSDIANTEVANLYSQLQSLQSLLGNNINQVQTPGYHYYADPQAMIDQERTQLQQDYQQQQSQIKATEAQQQQQQQTVSRLEEGSATAALAAAGALGTGGSGISYLKSIKDNSQFQLNTIQNNANQALLQAQVAYHQQDWQMMNQKIAEAKSMVDQYNQIQTQHFNDQLNLIQAQQQATKAQRDQIANDIVPSLYQQIQQNPDQAQNLISQYTAQGINPTALASGLITYKTSQDQQAVLDAASKAGFLSKTDVGGTVTLGGQTYTVAGTTAGAPTTMISQGGNVMQWSKKSDGSYGWVDSGIKSNQLTSANLLTGLSDIARIVQNSNWSADPTQKAIVAALSKALGVPIAVDTPNFKQGDWRTDRNNNPIAAAVGAGQTNEYTQALDQAGIKWTYGDPFPDNPKMVTIKPLGDPVEASRAILSNSGAIQNWYINHTGRDILGQLGVKNNVDFQNLPTDQQNQVITSIYGNEGGSGKLVGQTAPGGGLLGTTGSSAINPLAPGYTDTAVGNTGLSQAAIDGMALRYAMGDSSWRTSVPTGKTKAQTTAIQEAVANRAAEMDPAGNIVAHKAEVKALTSTLTQQTEYLTTTKRALQNADEGFQQLLTTFGNAGINTNDSRVQNQTLNTIAKNFSTTQMFAYNAALQEVSNEYTQVFSRGGQVTDTVRNRANDILDGNIPLSELAGVQKALQEQGNIVISGAERAVQGVQDQLSNILTPGGPVTQQQAQQSDYIAQLKDKAPAGEILVKQKSDGAYGYIPQDEYDPNLYDQP